MDKKKPSFLMGFVEYLYNRKFNDCLSFSQLKTFYFFATLIPLFVLQANGLINWLWIFIFLAAFISQYIFIIDYVLFSGGTFLYYGNLLFFLLKISNLVELSWIQCFVYPFFVMWIYYIVMFVWYSILTLLLKILTKIVLNSLK